MITDRVKESCELQRTKGRTNKKGHQEEEECEN